MLRFPIKANTLVDLIIKFSNTYEVIDNEGIVEVFNTNLMKARICQVFVDDTQNFKGAGLGFVY